MSILPPTLSMMMPLLNLYYEDTTPEPTYYGNNPPEPVYYDDTSLEPIYYDNASSYGIDHELDDLELYAKAESYRTSVATTWLSSAQCF